MLRDERDGKMVGQTKKESQKLEKENEKVLLVFLKERKPETK